MANFTESISPKGLYDPKFEHDNCGIGAVVDIKGKKSHQTVIDALHIVANLEHRAGKDAAGETGDGVGIMLQISHGFFSKECDFEIGSERDYGVGMFFFSQDAIVRSQEMKTLERIAKTEGVKFLGWREVPVIADVLGKTAKDCMPSIYQAFLARPENLSQGIEFDRKLYIIRRVFEQSQRGDTYVCSFSSRTIVYKGMFLVDQLPLFYKDLANEDYESAIGMVHSRFSTNTTPTWRRAHPNRIILHNGEINTIQGNADLMLSREETISSKHLDKDTLKKVFPIIDEAGSDSARLDNALEFMIMNGMDLPKAVMATIPEPWANDENMSRKKRDFYQYYATMLEPWDGPAAILFTDGDVMGAVLDRNGLRPSRYYITKDGKMILSSEVGVLDIPEERVLEKNRLRPGKMLLVDTIKGEVIDDDELKETYASKSPYGEWLDKNLVHLKSLKIPNEKSLSYPEVDLVRLQKAFGYKYEDVTSTILAMAKTGVEATGAMGDDTPLAPLSKNHPPLFNYFKQRFAQVTNPPIDAIREKVVTDTSVYIGKRGNLLEEKGENCRVLRVNNPILTETDLNKIKHMSKEGFKVATVSIAYYQNAGLEQAIENVFVEVDKAYKDGATIVVLSDRSVDELHVAIPSLLAVSAVSKYLIRTRKSTALALILESGEPKDVHDFATLLGYGACAVNPYLAHKTIEKIIEDGLLHKDYYVAVEDFNKAILDGIVKIASKMGVSTIQSYQGSQIFEAVGIDDKVIEKYFTGTVSRVGGIDLCDMEDDVLAHHREAYDPLLLDVSHELESGGYHKSRSEKEEHLYNPQTISLLQQAVRTGNYDLYTQYANLVNNEQTSHLRSLLDFKFCEKGGIDIDEVESEYEIVKRFSSGPMSYGSLSQEAHEALAIAMNNLGAKSNTGEGGELEERFTIGKDGVNRNSAVKQVASARFGVTSKFLVSAKEIQIKIAQGAKPGEGGHLPGTKVYPWVAKTRHSTVGVGLISPPPHHDIYSIEDLAQLIYDLKNANRKADISVKLVSEAGVGTIAAGVAKAGAQHITLSGYDGGTGAAPKTSICNAGLPWELGVAETHQTLILNGLRNKIRLEADSKMMSGRDLAIAAMLGAEQFSFATGPLVALGCVMMRVCNLDTCPMGIATQNPELRKRFIGKPAHVENFMLFMARNMREYMAKLGIKTVEELVGRSDLLMKKQNLDNPRAAKIDVTRILSNPLIENTCVHFESEASFDFELPSTMDMKVLIPSFKDSFDSAKPKTISVDIKNTDRSFGTIFGSDITAKYGNTLKESTFTVNINGSAGQSLGAFIPQGLTLQVEGDCNDYVGKGLSGGQIIVYPSKDAEFAREKNIIIGNVALYGATGGKLFASGVAGERFAVRNSGAVAVVEGVGDHGCEYMTGGMVVVLGTTGKNFAAGMSGGIAYVYDPNNDLYMRVNKSMVSLEEMEHKHDIETLKALITEHVEKTDSPLGRQVLESFEDNCAMFKKVLPNDYNKMLKLIAKKEEEGFDKEQAQVEAFYTLKKSS